MQTTTPSHAEDTLLLFRIAQGDSDALASLQDRMHGSVVARIRNAGGLPQDFDDIAQEVWIRVWKKAGTYKPHFTVHNWVLTIAQNRTHDWNRKHARSCEKIDRFTEVTLKEQEEEEKEAGWAVELDRVQILSRDLAPEERQILELCLQGATLEDVAERIGVSIATVKARSSRMRKKVRVLSVEKPAPEKTEGRWYQPDLFLYAKMRSLGLSDLTTNFSR